MNSEPTIRDVLVTGATGFVGRDVVRRLLARGLRPVCVVRSAQKLLRQHPDVDPERLVPVVGSLSDRGVLREAADLSQAAIHLVGIIVERWMRGQTFRGVHVRGTRNVVEAVSRAGITRYVHMSALGTRPDGRSKYHLTKWKGEEIVRASGLDWTIFRPSLIHGPDGEFMQLAKAFVSGVVPPVIPYFGNGQARIQPVSVKDVAHCFVESLYLPDTVGKVIPLGGPEAFSWLELWDRCRRHIPNARSGKAYISLSPGFAKTVAAMSAPVMTVTELILPSLGKFRFDAGQVDMATEDSTCDHGVAEEMFNMKMRGFESELATYADLIA